MFTLSRLVHIQNLTLLVSPPSFESIGFTTDSFESTGFATYSFESKRFCHIQNKISIKCSSFFKELLTLRLHHQNIKSIHLPKFPSAFKKKLFSLCVKSNQYIKSPFLERGLLAAKQFNLRQHMTICGEQEKIWSRKFGDTCFGNSRVNNNYLHEDTLDSSVFSSVSVFINLLLIYKWLLLIP